MKKKKNKKKMNPNLGQAVSVRVRLPNLTITGLGNCDVSRSEF